MHILASGFLCMRYGELLLKGEAKDLYQGILSQPNQPLKLKLQVGYPIQINFCTSRYELFLVFHCKLKILPLSVLSYN